MTLLKNPKFLIIFAGLAGAVFFFFPENDEKYLKKTTLKMIDLLVVPLNSSDMSSLIKRMRQITEPMHFSVQFELSQEDQIFFKRQSVAEMRPLLGMYFKSEERLTLQTIKEENLTVQISEESDEKKKAQVSFRVTGQVQNKSFNCQMKMNWEYEKDWKIYKIKGSDCQGIIVDDL